MFTCVNIYDIFLFLRCSRAKLKGCDYMDAIINNAIFSEYPDVISITDLMAMLKVGRNTAYKLLNENMIKTIKIGKKYIIPKISVIQFLQQTN